MNRAPVYSHLFTAKPGYVKPLIFLLLPVIAACTAPPEPAPAKLANPASEYCISVGGTLKIETKNDGQVGYCHLPSGKVVEEWTLFRSQAKKPSEQ